MIDSSCLSSSAQDQGGSGHVMGQEVRLEVTTRGWVVQEVISTRTGISDGSRKEGREEAF